MFYKENYEVVIIMRILLHQSIISKIFLVNAFFNIKHLLESHRLIYIMLFSLLKKPVILIS